MRIHEGLFHLVWSAGEYTLRKGQSVRSKLGLIKLNVEGSKVSNVANEERWHYCGIFNDKRPVHATQLNGFNGFNVSMLQCFRTYLYDVELYIRNCAKIRTAILANCARNFYIILYQWDENRELSVQ